jgi:hypothetical protein
MKQQIFDRFTQGEAGQGAVGSGLGLNIVKEFVELHGGTVVVVDAPGGGAVFQVEIPVRAPDGAFVRETGEARAARRLWRRRPAAGPARPPTGRASRGCWWPRTTPTCACFSTTC